MFIANYKTRHKRSHKRHKSLEIEDEVPEDLVPLLDNSCISQGTLQAPEIPHAKAVRYSRKRAPHKSELEEKKYSKGFLVVVYSCLEGYDFKEGSLQKMFCSKGVWIGEKPICEKSEVSTGRF